VVDLLQFDKKKGDAKKPLWNWVRFIRSDVTCGAMSGGAYQTPSPGTQLSNSIKKLCAPLTIHDILWAIHHKLYTRLYQRSDLDFVTCCFPRCLHPLTQRSERPLYLNV
jgi:hypothetical protein